MQSFQLCKARLRRSFGGKDQEVGHHALALPLGLVVQTRPSRLRDQSSKKPIHFGGGAYMHLLQVMGDLPFQSIMLCAPPIAGERSDYFIS